MGSITALAQTMIGTTQLLFSIAEDQQVCVYECSLDSAQQADSSVYKHWKLRQQLTLRSGLQHCLALAHLPDQPEW